MNKEHIKKSINHRVKLRPATKRFQRGIELSELDDDWVIEKISNEGVHIRNIEANFETILGFDQIYSYTSDPNRNHGELKHGFLMLHGQLCIDDSTVYYEPTERPGKPLVGKDRLLSEVIDWSALTPSIRSYLSQNDIVKVSDAGRIDFDNILRQKNIANKGVQKLVSQLVAHGILAETKYIQKLLKVK